jgi:hypothetical protein
LARSACAARERVRACSWAVISVTEELMNVPGP